MAISLGFKRARLSNVYSILRGKDLETGEFTAERRDEQFAVLKQAQARVLNLTYWHDFFKAIMQSGHRSSKTISSQTGLIYAYAFYLIGRCEYGVEEHRLRRAIARWFFMSSLTARYSSSPESAMEFDLARLREVKDAEAFVRALDRVCDESLTSDFWAITLPNELATSSPRSPSLFAFYGALVLLDAKVLFSPLKVADLLDPALHGNRAAIERHHLFPKGHLKRIGVSELRETNQIANFALVEWGDNADVSDKAPADYMPDYRDRLGASELQRMYGWHGLPDGWEALEYPDFLMKRRELIAGIIKDGFARLSGEAPADDQAAPSLEEIVGNGETSRVEFKATLRTNLHTGLIDPKMELAVLRTLAGFLNTTGGTLIIGVSDDGVPVGLSVDGFQNEDKMQLHLANLINGRIGPQFMMYMHPRFDDYQGKRVIAVECSPSKAEVYVKDGGADRFYIRTGVSTSELTNAQTQQFIKLRFK